ncbi:sugar phosphate isomerase/epimerase [Nitratireductor aquimarinus]|uniref:sugar phosphate isomerase/epimerase family protein n=1 Tax=Alphaproteobacteria TaxID=28211 RepID=UPI0019D3266A|nr:MULTISPECIES: sugar phosphate isomerase/epimerase family protein [Alphaproteobacteria]MBN7758064.1 sugar phosphate isomerase/epimerase [Nitratireductor aquimarinus]MBY6022857.1 sugar phosphate isomerase/epimerase [Nitratireductor sp. DP7N14-4]
MKLSLCNEVLRALSFEEQCRLASALRYDGLEVAPFTLSAEPASVPASERRRLRQMAADHGLEITGLHWLLTAPEGLSLTSDDAAVAARTRDHMLAMVELCADLGGSVLVHGSPGQRQLRDAASPEHARDIAMAHLAAAADAAAHAGVLYCIEPLAPSMDDFVNTVAEAVKLVETIGSPGFATMFDTYAAVGGEAEPAEAVLDRFLPGGHVRHIHFNDRSKRGPGLGADRFAPIVDCLVRHDYDGVIAVEPFDYYPDGPGVAAFAAGYVRGLLEMRKECS